MEFSEFLKKLRKENKLSIRQLGLYSDVSPAYLSQIENGSRGIPSPDVLKKLYKPLKVSYEELMKAAGYLEEEKDGQADKEEINTAFFDYDSLGKLPDEEILKLQEKVFLEWKRRMATKKENNED
jgi:transcriptional regulator with XRE-family HTH domain